MDKTELEAKFEVVKGMMQLMDGMFGFNDTDYGKGMMHGIISTIRALGLEADFQAFLKQQATTGSKAEKETE